MPFANIHIEKLSDGSQAFNVVVPASRDRPGIIFAAENYARAIELQQALERTSWMEVQS